MKLPENGVTNCELFQTRNSILERDYLKFSALCLLFSLLYSGFIVFFSFSFFFFKIPFIFHHSVHVYNEIPYLSLFSPNTPLLSSCFHVFYLYLIMQQAGLVESFPLCCDLSWHDSCQPWAVTTVAVSGSAVPMSCPEDSTSEHSSHSLVLTIFLLVLHCLLSPGIRRCWYICTRG